MFEQRPRIIACTFSLHVRPWITIDYPRAFPPRSDASRRSASTHSRGSRNIPIRPSGTVPGRTMRSGRRASCRSSRTRRFVRSWRKPAYSDPAATDFMTKTIIARRDKVVAAWINQVRPVVDAALSADGTLAFTNAAVDAKAATAPERYELRWFRFDNTTDQRTPVGEPMLVSSGSARAPDGLTVGRLRGRRGDGCARAAAWMGDSVDVLLPARRVRRGGELVARRRRTRAGETDARMMTDTGAPGQPSSFRRETERRWGPRAKPPNVVRNSSLMIRVRPGTHC